jgi:hypothetical protein
MSLLTLPLRYLLLLLMQVGASERVVVLLQLPAAKQLDQQALLQLLQTAVERKLSVSVMALCELPAVNALHAGRNIWTQLWEQAMATQGPGTLRALCQLPFACAALDRAAVLALLQVAAQCKAPQKLAALCQLAAAQHLNADDLTPLLQAAVAEGSLGKVKALAQLHGLEGMSREATRRCGIQHGIVLSRGT